MCNNILWSTTIEGVLLKYYTLYIRYTIDFILVLSLVSFDAVSTIKNVSFVVLLKKIQLNPLTEEKYLNFFNDHALTHFSTSN